MSFSPLFTAIENDDVSTLKSNLSTVDLNAFFSSRYSGYTPVQWAIKMFFKDLTTIKLLLDTAKTQNMLNEVIQSTIEASDWSQGMTSLEFAIKLQGTQRTPARRELTQTIQSYIS
eukprot:TRINITY_DN15881_c0_g1_i1.p1 TRINITY_DN15881_c0_g1~~TRINITY_DN15881_c0_g1_i1.p1  ORF type:complete len:116 (+),score=16.67 TRINITY_DN15881_c0_g1_i1:527-874(+)